MVQFEQRIIMIFRPTVVALITYLCGALGIYIFTILSSFGVFLEMDFTTQMLITNVPAAIIAAITFLVVLLDGYDKARKGECRCNVET